MFPPRCACCDADLPDAPAEVSLCDDCRQILGREGPPRCRRCGAVREGPGVGANGCPLCHRSKLWFDAVTPLGNYEGLLREVVLRMKRPGNEGLGESMARLLADRRGPDLAAFRADLIVPVPMFWARRLRRGTNSPSVVAEVLGRRLGVPVRPRWLVRRRNTLPQADLLPRQRFANVRGAFAVGRRALSRLEGARVLVVDDILTTGATCSEAARVLKQSSAACVVAAVIARAANPAAT